MQKTISHIRPYLIYLVAFTLPIGRATVVWAMLLLFLVWLLEGNHADKFRRILKNPGALLFIGFYSLHALSLLYTHNQATGWFDLQVKLPILISACILFSYEQPVARRRYTFYAFISGCITVIILSLWSSYSRYTVTHTFDEFLYERLAGRMHPSYLSMYMCFALILLIEYIFTETGLTRYIMLAIFPLLIAYIILLSAKTGIICCGVIILAAFYYVIFVKKLYKQALLFVLYLLSIGIITAGLTKNIIVRFKSAIEAVAGLSTVNQSSEESTSMRALVWKEAIGIIKEHPLTGVGAGDVKEVLIDRYKNNHIAGAYELKLNAHNAFLNAAVATGIIGALLLLTIFLYTSYLAVKRSDFILLMLAITLFINFLTEAMLETQSGVVFFSFFVCFILANPLRKEVSLS